MRIQAYKRLAEANSKEALQKLGRDWRDQFGPHPDAIRNLLTLNEIKLVAARAKVVSIEVKDSKVMLTRGGDYLLIGDRFPRLTSGEGENSLAQLASSLKSTFLTNTHALEAVVLLCYSPSVFSFRKSGPQTLRLSTGSPLW